MGTPLDTAIAQLDRCARIFEGLAKRLAAEEAKMDATQRMMTGRGLGDHERVSITLMSEARACVAAVATLKGTP